MIIAVSDVHLGWKDNTETFTKQDEFLKFLKYCDTDRIDHFVLLGDIFDFWARSNTKIFCSADKDEKIQQTIKNNEEIFLKLHSLGVKNIHYVVGNHDYLIHELHNRNPDAYPFSIHKTLRLPDGGKDFFFTHGYDLDVYANMESLGMGIESYEKTCYALSFLTDKTGWAAVNTWGLKEKIGQFMDALKRMNIDPRERGSDFDAIELLANSGAVPLFLGMHPSDNIVYGHTHRPYITQGSGGNMIANTGCWRGRNADEPGAVNTFVKIDNGEMSVCSFKGGDIFKGCH